MSKDTLLVVGGCGCLGYSIVKQALEDGYDVAVLDIRTTINRHNKATYFEGSLASRDTVLRVLKETQATVVMNTASPNGVNVSDNAIYDEVNINGTETLLECAQESGTVKAFIYTSSSSVTHDNYSDLINVTEDRPYVFAPEQPVYYTHTKAIAEKAVLTGNGRNGVLTTALRPAAVYGEGDVLTIPTQIANARKGRNRFQVGDGRNFFDWTYGPNLAHAHLLAAKALLREYERPPPAHLKVAGEAFNITNDEPWPFWDMPRAVGAAAGYPVTKKDIWIIPAWAYLCIVVCVEWFVWSTSFGKRQAAMNRKMVRFVTMTRTFNISKAKERLGYRAPTSMQDSIRRSVDWYLANEQGKRKLE